jgi:hypothetical protein
MQIFWESRDSREMTRLGMFWLPSVEHCLVFQIDLATFLTLTETDLRELGITTFGARRKMLLAIAGKSVHQQSDWTRVLIISTIPRIASKIPFHLISVLISVFMYACIMIDLWFSFWNFCVNSCKFKKFNIRCHFWHFNCWINTWKVQLSARCKSIQH